MLTPLIEGLGFAEGLRWHQGRLWFSDFLTRKVQAVGDNGDAETIGFVPGQPSGLGFMPDGTPCVVSMLDRRLLCLAPEQLREIADLRVAGVPPCNDLLVDVSGRAYIGTFSYELWYEQAPVGANSPLLLVEPSGAVSVAADGLHMPNGIALLPGGKTLVVAETGACRLTAFDVAGNGRLSNRRIFADLGALHPDGLCADAEGCVWVAGLYDGGFRRLHEGGEVLAEIPTPGCWAVSCALGGPDGRRLFCATTTVNRANDLRMGRCRSRISYADVAVEAAGHQSGIPLSS